MLLNWIKKKYVFKLEHHNKLFYPKAYEKKPQTRIKLLGSMVLTRDSDDKLVL